jgi:hypothetical protein
MISQKFQITKVKLNMAKSVYKMTMYQNKKILHIFLKYIKNYLKLFF